MSECREAPQYFVGVTSYVLKAMLLVKGTNWGRLTTLLALTGTLGGGTEVFKRARRTHLITRSC